MAQFRNKLAVIDAIRISRVMTVKTLEGIHEGRPGDWLITDVKGGQHFCSDDTFRQRYEAVGEQAADLLAAKPQHETETFGPPLDKGIERAVLLLREKGIETVASCEGGEGHACHEPTIRFEGDRGEGFKALAVVLQNRLPVRALNRTWSVIDGEPTGPFWELIFVRGGWRWGDCGAQENDSE